LKKEAKNFYPAVAVLSGSVSQVAKVFWFFFSKKNRFLSATRPSAAAA
jgi:hypothetical protein